MAIVTTKNGRKVQVVSAQNRMNTISKNDREMDARATQSVKAAISKAEFCQKPIAKYDVVTKKAYLQYANGEKRYVN